jgi:hypothetical protein
VAGLPFENASIDLEINSQARPFWPRFLFPGQFKMDREVPIKLCKALGEWAELRFMVRAAEEGLRAAKPYGESASYDFIVEHKRRFLRVQVSHPQQAVQFLLLPRAKKPSSGIYQGAH